MKNKKKKKNFLTLNTVIIFLNILLVIYTSSHLFIHFMSKYLKKIEPLEPGLQFEKFRPVVKGQKEMGFLTNKSMNPEHNDGVFLQAQYFLAPTIIRLQDPKHKFLILDSEDVPYAVFTMRKLNAKRITNNLYGQALIRRKQW